MLSRRSLLLAGLSAGALAAVAFQVTRSTAGSTSKTFEIAKSDEEWKKQLTPEQFYVLRKHGTERAFTSPLD
jgi:peptide-methionine (R)-S-oxide reductase